MNFSHSMYLDGYQGLISRLLAYIDNKHLIVDVNFLIN